MSGVFSELCDDTGDVLAGLGQIVAGKPGHDDVMAGLKNCMLSFLTETAQVTRLQRWWSLALGFTPSMSC